MKLKIKALPTGIVRGYQHGDPDAYGNVPERTVSDGKGNPCRHCLAEIPEGEEMLILAYRPFNGLHPYAETGPIFLCADLCRRHADAAELPEMMAGADTYLVRGYDARDRIVYGSGGVIPTSKVMERCGAILENAGVAYLHIRSAKNNCYQARVERG